MCQALQELLKDDLEAREKKVEQRGEQNAMVQSIRNVMESFGVSLEKAMDSLKIPPEQRSLYTGLVKGA